MRLAVKAIDASGKPVNNAIVRYTMCGGTNEGRVDARCQPRVTDEGIGSQPGTVDVIDLDAPQKVASIDFWKTE